VQNEDVRDALKRGAKVARDGRHAGSLIEASPGLLDEGGARGQDCALALLVVLALDVLDQVALLVLAP
jgi:hypothetical protein